MITEPASPTADGSLHLAESDQLQPLGDNETLLTAPLGEQFDNITALYLLMSNDARADSRSSLEEIKRVNEERAQAWEQHLEALRQAREAQEDESFWGSLGETFGKVAQVAGVVASVALAVGTAGAATPIAALAISGAVLSSASFAQSQFGAFDGVFGEELADQVGFGMGIAGGVSTLGAAGVGLIGGLGQTAEAATTVERVSTTMGHGAAVVSGGAAVAAGSAELARADAERDSLHHQADARRAYLQTQLYQFLLTQLVDEFEAAKERETANLGRITEMNVAQGAALTAAAGGAV